MNKYALWFRRVVFVGILANCFLALPGIFIPNTVIEFVRGTPLPPAFAIWPAFASLLLLLLSLLYIPAAVDPFRYRPVAYLAVASRFAGVWFFLVLQKQYQLFGLMDLFFGVIELILLVLAYRHSSDER